MEPIYRVLPGETGTPRVERLDRVERTRLLTPEEREQARRQREGKREERRKAAPKNPPKDRQGGVDYSV